MNDPINSNVDISTLQPRPSRAGFFFALILILVGTLLLLNNLGLVDWRIWGVLWRAWPVFVILLGLQVMLGHSGWRDWLVGIAGVVSVIAIVVYAVSVSNTSFNGWVKSQLPWWQPEMIKLQDNSKKQDQIIIKKSDFENVKHRTLDVSIGSQQFELGDDDSEDFLTLNSIYYSAGKPELKSRLDEKGQLRIDFQPARDRGWNFMFNESKYDFSLGQSSLVSRLNFDIGSGSGAVNLKLQMTDKIDVSVGSGSLQLSLDPVAIPTDEIKLSVGSGSVSLNIPKEVGVRIAPAIGSGSLALDNIEIEDGDTYTSANYNTATQKMSIVVDLGSGSVNIETD